MNRKIVFFLIAVLTMTVLSGCGFFSNVKHLEEGVGQQPPGPTYPAKDSLLAKHIPGMVIVKTCDEAELNKILEEFDGTVIRSIEDLNTHEIRLDQLVNNSLVTTMDSIKEIAKVDYVEPVYVYQLTMTLEDSEYYTRQWGPMDIRLDAALGMSNKGYGVTIAILDTGLDFNHPEFDNRILPGYNAITQESGYYEVTMDDHGHGTHVAGIAAANINSGMMAGIAPESKILPVKVLEGGSDLTKALWVADGIKWATDHGAQVINMSLSGEGYSQALQDAVNYALSYDVVVVASMGNSGSNESLYPAACSGVIAVGAVNGRKEVADFSTKGRHISVSAPGVDIFSSYPDSYYTNFSGTSMAAPHVAGAVALLLSDHPDLRPVEVRTRLENSAVDLGMPGFDEAYGHGMIDLLELLIDSSDSEYGIMQVFVEEKGDPLKDIDVIVVDEVTGKTVKNLRTDQHGYVYFHNLEPGSYLVTATRGDFSKTNNVMVNGGTLTEVSFDLYNPTYNILSSEYINESDGVMDFSIPISKAGTYQFSTKYYMTDCDTELTLYDSEYNQIAYNDDISAGNHYSKIVIDLQSGDYYIKVEKVTFGTLDCILEVGKWE